MSLDHLLHADCIPFIGFFLLREVFVFHQIVSFLDEERGTGRQRLRQVRVQVKLIDILGRASRGKQIFHVVEVCEEAYSWLLLFLDFLD